MRQESACCAAPMMGPIRCSPSSPLGSRSMLTPIRDRAVRDTNTSNTYYYTLAGQTLGTWDGTSPGSPTTNFLLTDTLGSVVSSFNNLPNGAAVVLGDQVYGPYGNRRVQQGTISTSKGFTGQFTDFVAGLDYYGARFYDPVVGVFVSADTVQGNMQGMNPYGYVGGNPETNTDPTGQFIYDPETGQAARVVNGKVQIWQYNSGLESSPPLLVLPPSFVAAVQSVGSLWGHYQIPDLGQKVGSSSSGSSTSAPSNTETDRLKPISLCESSGLFGCHYPTICATR